MLRLQTNLLYGRRMARFGKRKRSFKPKSRKSKRYTRRLNKRVKRVERTVKRINSSIETKHYEGVAVQDPIAITANFYALSVVPRAGSASDANVGASTYREGDKIHISSIDLSLLLQTNTADINTTWRIMLLWEKFPQYTSSTYWPTDETVILDNTSTNAYIKNMAGRNWDNRKRFKCIYDKMFTTYRESSSSTLPGPTRKLLRLHFKVNKNVTYQPLATTATLTGNRAQYARENLLWLMVLNDSTQVTTKPLASMWYRVKFQDS